MNCCVLSILLQSNTFQSQTSWCLKRDREQLYLTNNLYMTWKCLRTKHYPFILWFAWKCLFSWNLWNHFSLLCELIEKVRKASVKILNFASLFPWMRAPNRGITTFVLNTLGVVTTHTVIIYAIFMNNPGDGKTSVCERAQSHCSKHLTWL